MNAIGSLSRELRDLRGRGPLLGRLYVIKLAWAILWTWPFYTLLRKATELRPYADRLGEGVDLDVLREVLGHHPEIVTAGLASAVAGSLGWLLVSWLLVALILSYRTRDAAERSAWPLDVRAWWLPLAKLHFFAAAPYALALALALLAGTVGIWFGATSGMPLAIGVFAVALIPALGVGLLTGASLDLARVEVALVGSPASAYRALGAAFGRVRRDRRLLTVQVLGLGLWVGLGALYLALAWPGQYASGMGLVVLTVLRQALVFGWLSLRVATIGAVVRLTKEA